MSNEMTKAQLKKRLTIQQVPGPGEYETGKQIGASSMINSLIAADDLIRNVKERRHLSTLGIQDK